MGGDPLPLPPSSSGDDGDPFGTWYGNIDYLLNISAIGSACCLLIFLFVKLRSDHRRIPGPAALASKLLAVWHATGREIARHCGADAAQFLLIEGGSCALLLSLAVLAVTVLLPLNLSAGTAVIDDGFSRTTITNIEKGSSLLWIHFLFAVVVVFLVHFGISATEERLRITRFRDGYGNLSDPTSNSTAIFTIMVQGLPKIIAVDCKEGRTPGAVVAFVMFRDVYTANKAVQDFQNEKRRRIGKFFSVMELRLQRNQWKVERAPLATDIYWKNMGTPRLSLKSLNKEIA